MDASLLARFAALAHENAGIRLCDGKEELVAARIGRRLRALGLESERAYLDLLERDGGPEIVHFLDAISTNFTGFFREEEHFAELAVEAAAWAAGGRRRLRFWSAAASSGEEPYSMAMVLEESLAGLDVDYRILATDLSTRALGVASLGVYGEARMAPVPRARRLRHFARVDGPGREGKAYRVVDAIRDRVAFARLNLAAPPFPMCGPIDAVLCRNVMIYFEQGVCQALVAEIERVLAPGGLLMIGHSETLNGLTTALRPERPSVYRKPDLAGGRRGPCRS
jgi:chemotaxis protein methyltransferase CheR